MQRISIEFQRITMELHNSTDNKICELLRFIFLWDPKKQSQCKYPKKTIGVHSQKKKKKNRSSQCILFVHQPFKNQCRSDMLEAHYSYLGEVMCWRSKAEKSYKAGEKVMDEVSFSLQYLWDENCLFCSVYAIHSTIEALGF